MTSLIVVYFYKVYSKVCKNDDIVIGLVSVINSISDNNLKTELLHKICQPFAQKILEDKALIPGKEVENTREEKTGRLSISRVIKNLEKLTLIVQNLTPAEDTDQDHVMVHVVKELWPLLETFMKQYYVHHNNLGHAQHNRINLQANKVCNAVHKASVRSVHRAVLQYHNRKLQRNPSLP